MYRKDIIGYVLSGTLHTLTNFHTPQTIIVTMLLMRKLELMNKSKSICPRSSSLEDAEPELARSCLTMAGHLLLAHMVLYQASHTDTCLRATLPVDRADASCSLETDSGTSNHQPWTLSDLTEDQQPRLPSLLRRGTCFSHPSSQFWC